VPNLWDRVERTLRDPGRAGFTFVNDNAGGNLENTLGQDLFFAGSPMTPLAASLSISWRRVKAWNSPTTNTKSKTVGEKVSYDITVAQPNTDDSQMFLLNLPLHLVP